MTKQAAKKEAPAKKAAPAKAKKEAETKHKVKLDTGPLVPTMAVYHNGNELILSYSEELTVSAAELKAVFVTADLTGSPLRVDGKLRQPVLPQQEEGE